MKKDVLILSIAFMYTLANVLYLVAVYSKLIETIA